MRAKCGGRKGLRCAARREEEAKEVGASSSIVGWQVVSLANTDQAAGELKKGIS